jgi:hypothetical protein
MFQPLEGFMHIASSNVIHYNFKKMFPLHMQELDSSHLPSKQEKTVTEPYVPSSTAIDNRKFRSNPGFPLELMDPAFCFSVVSYNILADCHMRRLVVHLWLGSPANGIIKSVVFTCEGVVVSLSLRTRWHHCRQDIPIAAPPPILATIE